MDFLDIAAIHCRKLESIIFLQSVSGKVYDISPGWISSLLKNNAKLTSLKLELSDGLRYPACKAIRANQKGRVPLKNLSYRCVW